MVNKVILVGRLGQDPELRYTQNGQAVASFTMATSESWRDKDGERQERTEWHRIVAWGNQAEFCGNFLHKGRLVYVEGRLQSRDWEDKEGQKRRTTEIIAQKIQGLSRRENGEGGDEAADRRDEQEAAPETPSEESEKPRTRRKRASRKKTESDAGNQPEPEGTDVPNDDIPF